MKKKFIVFGKPYSNQEEIEEVVKTLKSGWWGTGPKTELFEKKFAAYAKAKYAVAVSSCTAGLHLALLSLGIKQGDEVITTPLTFVATANVIIHCGATPVFVDVDRQTGLINVEEIEKKITKKTKAIMPVHLYGRPCDMDKIKALAKKYKLFVIEDAAHAIESVYEQKKVGSIGDITVFSFYVTKNMTTGEGGMITTNNKKLAERMRILSLHGLSRDAYKRYSTRLFSLYECLMPGFKYNMTDLQSSLGLHQLKRIKKNASIRKKQWNKYDQLFTDNDSIEIPYLEDPNTYHARHLYTVLIKNKSLRNTVIQQLLDHGVGTGVHFMPVHLHGFYRKTYGYKKSDFPNTEYIGSRTISLPLGPSYTMDEIKYVGKTLTNILKNIKPSSFRT